jgi:hypothetical protein
VEAARLELQRALSTLGMALPNLKVQEAITRRLVRAYRAAAETLPPKQEHSMSPGTKALMAMAVGDEIDAEGLQPSAWRNRMSTARRLMANPAVRWLFVTLGPGNVVIRRLPDGTAPKRALGPRAQRLAAVGLWEKRTFTRDEIGVRLDRSTKMAARKILDLPTAEWRSASTNKGLRVERIR